MVEFRYVKWNNTAQKIVEKACYKKKIKRKFKKKLCVFLSTHTHIYIYICFNQPKKNIKKTGSELPHESVQQRVPFRVQKPTPPSLRVLKVIGMKFETQHWDHPTNIFIDKFPIFYIAQVGETPWFRYWKSKNLNVQNRNSLFQIRCFCICMCKCMH